jgi:hypothetical protein
MAKPLIEKILNKRTAKKASPKAPKKKGGEERFTTCITAVIWRSASGSRKRTLSWSR